MLTRERAEAIAIESVRNDVHRRIRDGSVVLEFPRVYAIDLDLTQNDPLGTVMGPLNVDQSLNDVSPIVHEFFVDDMPSANWGHQCRYLIVHDDESLTVIDESYPPSTDANVPIEEVQGVFGA